MFQRFLAAAFGCVASGYISPDCAPCNCDGSPECPGMAWTCKNDAWINCGTDSTARTMFQMNPDDFCTCPNTTKGWDCALANPNYPCPSGQQYDNQWLNDVNPDKLIQCVAVPPYPGFLSLITFVHTRLEMHVYNGTSFRATIYGREYKATRQQCEQVAPILDCNFTGCDGTAFSDGTTSYDNCAITECTQFSFMNITSGYAKFDKPFADGWALGEINTDTSIGPLNLLLNCSIGGCSPGVEANVFTQVQYDIFYSTLGTVGIITAALAVTIIVLVFGFRHRPNLSQTYQKVKEKPSETSTSLSNGFSTETSKVSAGASSDEKTLAGSGTLSGKDDSAAAIVFSSVEFDPNVASLVFDKVNYIIPEISRQILTNISGYAQRGNVTAIMGLSGSGKTSLLEILCGYRRISSGKVFATKCDNKPAADVIQFVAQQDLLQAELTVHEAMLFTCQLRCRMSLEDCKKRVQDKLELLRLTHLTNNLIGDPFHGGLSGGQRRLTSVAMELLSEPLFLVLDEPASGLDSNNAEHLFEVLRAVASQNCGVVLTVHAPSTKLLSMMDILLVLSPIGHMGYFGPPKDLPTFFKVCGNPLPPRTNPASHIIEILYDGTEEDLTKLEQSYFASDTFGKVVKDIAALRDVDAALGKVLELGGDSGATPTMAPIWMQFKLLFWREFMILSRQPLTIVIQNLLLSVIGLCLGAIFANLDLYEEGAQNRLGVLFFLPMFFALTATSAVTMFIVDRPRYWRQCSMGMYTPVPYFLAKAISDLMLMRALPPVFISVVAYPMIGLQPLASKFWIFLSVLVLVQLFSVLFCYWVSASSGSTGSATLVVITVLVLSLVFGGLLLNLDTNQFALSVSIVSCIRLAYEALCVNELTDLILLFKIPGGSGARLAVNGEVLMYTAGIHADRMDINITLLALYCLGLCGLCILSLTFLNLSPLQTGGLAWYKRCFIYCRTKCCAGSTKPVQKFVQGTGLEEVEMDAPDGKDKNVSVAQSMIAAAKAEAKVKNE